MSLGTGLPGYRTTDILKKTGFQGPILAGKVADGASAGMHLPTAGGVMCVQSTASLTAQVVSTADAVIGNRASFIYIPVTTGPLNGAAAPPYVGVGTPLVWDDTNKRLSIWSSGSSSWMTQLSSVGGGYFTTS